MKLSKKFGVVAVAVGLIVGLAPAAQAVDLTGAGASFPALLIEVAPTNELFSRPRDKRTEDYVTGRFG